jgi:hypothetical protein
VLRDSVVTEARHLAEIAGRLNSLLGEAAVTLTPKDGA